MEKSNKPDRTNKIKFLKGFIKPACCCGTRIVPEEEEEEQEQTNRGSSSVSEKHSDKTTPR